MKAAFLRTGIHRFVHARTHLDFSFFFHAFTISDVLVFCFLYCWGGDNATGDL